MAYTGCRTANNRFTRRDVLTAALFGATVISFVLAWAYPVWPGDEALLQGVQGWRSGLLDAIFAAVSLLGWYPVAAGLAAATLAALLARKLWTEALLLAVVVLAALPAYALKDVVGRARPDYALLEQVPQSLSFPSGHATFAALLGCFLIYLLSEHGGRPLARWMLVAALLLAMAAVGISRIYLGLHWPSDVAGGYLYGATVVALTARLTTRLKGAISARSQGKVSRKQE